MLLSGKTLDIKAGRGPMSARDVAIWGALAVAAANGLVGLFGAARWYWFAPSREFWLGVRAGQGLALAYADTIQTVFVIAAPIGIIAFLASLFIPHVELRQGIAAPTGTPPDPEERELLTPASTASLA